MSIAEIEQMRAGFDGLGDQVTMATGVTVEPISVAGVPCYWIKTERRLTDTCVIVYLHGGAFTLGSIRSHGNWVSHLVDKTGLDALFVDYRLAPDTPYPAGPEDAAAAISGLLETDAMLSIILVGDSAGGGLIATIMPEIKGKWGERISACVLLSPLVDLSCTLPSYKTQSERDPKLTLDGVRMHAALYLADTPMQDANPMARLEVPFPPTLILVGTDEVLLDDSKLAFEKISLKQENCTLRVMEGETHVWVMDDVDSEASVATFEDIVTFIGEIDRPTNKEK